MNILIAYSSTTGNTKKVAEAVKSGIPQADFFPIKDVKDVNEYDLIVVGGWIDKGTFNAEALNFVKSIKNKKTAYFFTLGAYPDSDHAKHCTENLDKLFEENSNEIVGRFLCQGAIDPKLIEFMSKLPADHIMAPNPERKQRWIDAASHPDDNDLKNAKAFAESII